MNHPTATVKILNEINCCIIGLEEDDVEYFWNRYGIYRDGYQFMGKFKIGRWDGKDRFFTKGAKTYVQLLPEIIPELKTRGYKLSLMDNRKQWNIDIPLIDDTYLNNYNHPETGAPIILGAHQVEAINAVTQNTIGIIRAATNAGKTLMCSALCRLFKEHCSFKCLIIVPNKDLLKQTAKVIAHYGNDVGLYGDGLKDIEHDHLVSTWQSLQNFKQLVALYDVVIVDECHGVKATVIKEIINDAGGDAAVKIGMTGTLPKSESDQMSIRISLGNVIYEIPSHELIAIGWSAKLKLRMIRLIENVKSQWVKFQEEFPKEAAKLTYAKYKDKYFPDFDSESKWLKNKKERNQFIVDVVESARSRGNCFVLVNGVAYGKKLASMIPNAYFIYGNDKQEARQQIYNLFKENNDIVVVSSFQLASVGLDIPRIFNLFLIDAGKSFERVIQSIGRGLRKASDKDTIFVYDISSDFRYGRDHGNKRKRYYKEEKFEFTYDEVDYLELSDEN